MPIYQVYAFQTSSNNIVAAFLDVTESKQAEVEREAALNGLGIKLTKTSQAK